MMRRCIKWTQWWIEGLRKRRQAWKKEADGGKGFKIKYYKGGSWKKTHGKTTRDCAKRHES